VFVVHEVVDAHDVFVGQLKAAPSFPLQIVQERAVVNNDIGKKLQSDFPLQFLIARQPDDSHSAAAQNRLECIAAEDLLPARALTHRRIRASTQIVSRSHFHSSSTKRRSSFLAAIASGRSSDQSWAWLNFAATSN